MLISPWKPTMIFFQRVLVFIWFVWICILTFIIHSFYRISEGLHHNQFESSVQLPLRGTIIRQSVGDGGKASLGLKYPTTHSWWQVITSLLWYIHMLFCVMQQDMMIFIWHSKLVWYKVWSKSCMCQSCMYFQLERAHQCVLHWRFWSCATTSAAMRGKGVCEDVNISERKAPFAVGVEYAQHPWCKKGLFHPACSWSWGHVLARSVDIPQHRWKSSQCVRELLYFV